MPRELKTAERVALHEARQRELDKAEAKRRTDAQIKFVRGLGFHRDPKGVRGAPSRLQILNGYLKAMATCTYHPLVNQDELRQFVLEEIKKEGG